MSYKSFLIGGRLVPRFVINGLLLRNEIIQQQMLLNFATLIFLHTMFSKYLAVAFSTVTLHVI